MKLKYRLYSPLEDEATPASGATPTPQLENEPAVETTDWDDLDDTSTEDSGWADEAIPPAPPAPPVEVAPAEPPAVEEPRAAEAVVQPPIEAPVYTPEQIAEAESGFKKALATRYRFSEDDVLRLQTEPENVLPEMAASLHLEIMKAIATQVQGMLPEAIERNQQSSRRETEARTTFYSAWPELAGHDQHVLQVGRMFREMNPNADPATAVEKIGELAMVALGKSRKAVEPVAAPVAPQAFRPAGVGKVNPPPATQSVWDEMALDDD